MKLAGMSVILAALAAPSGALGQFNVEYWNGSSWVTITSGINPGSNVTIDDTQSPSRTYRIYSLTPDSSTQYLGNVQINSISTGTPTLFVGRGLVVPDELQMLSSAGAYNIEGISYSGGKPRLQVRVSNHINGDISFWHIVRIDAGNHIYGNVTHDPTGASSPIPRLGVVSAFAVGHAGAGIRTVKAVKGDIFNVLANQNIYSDVTSTEGSIELVQAGLTTAGYVSGNINALNGAIGSDVRMWSAGPVSSLDLRMSG